jgi:hypothetical protein
VMGRHRRAFRPCACGEFPARLQEEGCMKRGMLGQPDLMSLVIQKVKLDAEFSPRLEELMIKPRGCIQRMLSNRAESSSKHYPEVPCVLAKSQIAKYQRNSACQSVERMVLPICGDKGKQVKLAEGGFRVPAFFKKEVIPVAAWLHPIEGHIRNVEFLCRKGEWFAHVCYATKCAAPIKPEGCIGVDRNSVGNVAVLAVRTMAR